MKIKCQHLTNTQHIKASNLCEQSLLHKPNGFELSLLLYNNNYKHQEENSSIVNVETRRQ